ncbi:hypothetical protein [Sphingobacterium bambusae]|uniref:Lipoprotein n=1 Tax=Sphingobacterium bambusae TaxID=662858 RepID=A0ABW6BL31_9SPHI|nr:hypothetical protein [Sphingobacterium bambusae]WPL48972.1 hypothetical protein SCB77_00655 [Sphingobacterium bambusae]
MMNVSKFAWVMTLSTSLFVACSGGKGTGQSEQEDTQEGTSVVEGLGNLGNLQDGASKMEEMQAQLKNVTKLSNEELKAFFPENLNGWRRSAYSGGNQAYGVDVASGNAVYEAQDDKELMLTLTDGAGETGAAVVSLMAMGLTMDSEKDSDYEVTKNEDVHGYRASTRETKPQQEGSIVDSDITFIYKDRYLVKLEGDGFKLDELKDLVGKLNFSALK